MGESDAATTTESLRWPPNSDEFWSFIITAFECINRHPCRGAANQSTCKANLTKWGMQTCLLLGHNFKELSFIFIYQSGTDWKRKDSNKHSLKKDQYTILTIHPKDHLNSTLLMPSRSLKSQYCLPDGNYEFKRMPFGLSNASVAFQIMINKVFGSWRYEYVLAKIPCFRYWKIS